jgi:hypothetical protein
MGSEAEVPGVMVCGDGKTTFQLEINVKIALAKPMIATSIGAVCEVIFIVLVELKQKQVLGCPLTGAVSTFLHLINER